MKNLLCIFVLSGLISGCDQPKESSELKAAKGGRFYGGTFRFSQTEYIRSLYPPALTEAVSARVAGNIYEGLFCFDPVDLVAKPCLVESYEANQDSSVYTFQLKKGVFFHDDACFPNGKGRELKASDVKFCLTQLCSQTADNQGFVLFKDILKGANRYYEASGNGKILGFPLAGFELIDDYRFRLVLEKPFPQLPMQLARPFAFIYPVEAVRKYGTARPKAVGTGPFYLADVEREISIVLKRNPRYHRRDKFGNQLPLLDGIAIQFIPDKSSELAEFRQGRSQMMYHLPTAQFLEILKSAQDQPADEWKNVVLKHEPEMTTHFVAFNLKDSFFKNLAVRRAVARSIDKSAILGTVLRGEGLGTATHGLTPPLFKTYRTNTLVGDRGLVENAPPNEPMKLPSGKKITLSFYADGSRNTLVAVSIVEQIKSTLGIDIDLKPLSLAKFYDGLLSGEFSMALVSKTADYPSPFSFLEMAYGQNSIFNKGKTSPNFFHYKNPVFDSSYRQALLSPLKEDAAKSLLKAEQILLDDAAVVPLWYDEGYYLIRKNVKNIVINRMALLDFSNVYFMPDSKPTVPAAR